MVLGGVVAGVVINALEILLNVVLEDQLSTAIEDLGLSSQLGGTAMMLGFFSGFALGIGCIWLYAAIRPRYGAGLMTAIRAGVSVWFFSVFLALLSFWQFSLFPTQLLIIVGIWGLVELPLATTIGSWLYSEDEEQGEAAAA